MDLPSPAWRPSRAQPPLGEARLDAALQWLRRGDSERACRQLEAVLDLEPQHLGALNLLALLAARAGHLERALALFERSLALDHGQVGAHCNRGLALQGLKRAEEALASFDQALALDPRCAEAHFNRANLLREQGRWGEALSSYDRAIAARPEYAEAFCNRGVLLADLRRIEPALASIDRALALAPQSAAAHVSRAATLLLMGDFARGWPEYEWRLRLEGGPAAQWTPLREPVWSGHEDLAGRSILVRSEQGLGDTLQFCRYLAPLAAHGARVVLEVQAPLLTLLAGLPGLAQVLARGSPLPAFDYWIPLLSLPGRLGVRLESLSSTRPYLRPDPAQVADWRRRLGPQRGPRIGLAWSGSALHPGDAERSLALADLLPRLPVGAQYVCLQREVRERDRQPLVESGVLHVSDGLADFSDTAALVECLDLILSVDTSVGHLAAALGRPTWLLLPFNAAWRWFIGRDDSPWYPSVRLWRQPAPGDWPAVLERVGAALTDWLRATSGGAAPPPSAS